MVKNFNELGARKQDKILLSLWEKIVKQRAGYKCERCGKHLFLNAHHIYGRTNYKVRYDIENGACLCPGHHTLNKDAAHNAPLEFIEFMIKKRGNKWFDRLRKKAMTENIKPDKEKIYEGLKSLLND